MTSNVLYGTVISNPHHVLGSLMRLSIFLLYETLRKTHVSTRPENELFTRVVQ